MKAILLDRILLVLAFIGLFVASALSIEKYMNVVLPCGNTSGCETVAHDPSSMLFGVIPVAYIGLAGYLLFAGLAIARCMKFPYNPLLVTVGYGAAAFGAAFSIYLQYLSFFKIHAVCPYCLTSAITMILTVIAYALLYKAYKREADSPPREAQKADMWLMGGLPLLVVFSLAMLGGSDKKGPIETSNIELNEKNLVPDRGNFFGSDDAPMTIVEFADLTCPACQATSPKVKQFSADHPGKIRIVFRHFPLNKHTYSHIAAAMSEIAADKGQFWDFSSSVMGLKREPESVDELLDIAKSIGMNPDDVKKRLQNENDPVYDRVTRDINLAKKIGVSSTPTFIILVKGMKPESATSSNIMDTLNGKEYKKIFDPAHAQ